MALPCRISIYTDKGKTMIGLIKPEPMLSWLSSDPSLREIAAEVEKLIIQMVDKAK